MALLEVRDLHLTIGAFEGRAHILNGISFDVERGQIWGLVGETGCGKSMTGLSVSQLVNRPPTAYPQGSIRFDGSELLNAPEAEMRALRGRRIGMIFQDPTTNLNPVFTVGQQMIDVALNAAKSDPVILGLTAKAGRRERRTAARAHAIGMLAKVGIADAERRIDSYPHEFSGGMRQRVLIAMALIGKPELLIADEPTTALDVSIQIQIQELIHGLVREYDLAVLLITHNLAVVAQLYTHVAVMYAGNIVESGTTVEVLERPTHPYTRALLDSIPKASEEPQALRALDGGVPDLFAPPPGCRLEPRCPHRRDECRLRVPPPVRVGANHDVSCVMAEPA